MVQAQIVTHVRECPQSPTFGIRYPMDTAVDTRVHHKPCTHEAGLKRHIDHAARKVPAPELPNRFYRRTELRIGREIMVELTAVMDGNYSFAIADDGGALPEPPLPRQHSRPLKRLSASRTSFSLEPSPMPSSLCRTRMIPVYDSKPRETMINSQ